MRMLHGIAEKIASAAINRTMEGADVVRT